jgi:hypothetical protein
VQWLASNYVDQDECCFFGMYNALVATMRAIWCAVLMALATTTAGAAENLNSANYWLPRCKEFIAANSNRDLDGQEVCAGRVEALSLASCPHTPNDITPAQAVRVVVRYIEERPQRIHESFNALALEALHDAWPCKP